MTPLFAAGAAGIAILVGLPLWCNAAPEIVVPAVLGGMVCAAGIRLRFVAVAVLGGILALLALALAGRGPGGLAGLVVFAGFGLAQWLVVETAALAARFHGAAVEGAIWRAWGLEWVGRIAVVLGAAAILGALGMVVAPALPALPRAPLAALGLLVAAGAAWRASCRPEQTSRNPAAPSLDVETSRC
ncbi:MAG TPA: hypothetical protein VHD15_03800 [Hyphomicrobiales bacterium]|nr:hypothetical protein [Hyphomicrobiales bacterium]